MSCDIYGNNSFWGTVAAACFGFAIFLSYVPQQVAIVAHQSTEGINPYFLMLMNMGSSFAFANAVVLSRPIFSCCATSLGAFDCMSSLVGTGQLMAGFLGPAILLLLAIRFREPGPNGDGVIRSAKIVGYANAVSWILVLLISDPVDSKKLATVLGLAALSVGFVQYFPQLYTTFKLKHTGSLSITMMLLQIPGGYLWCFSLASRKGSHWSTWISLFAAATFQLILLCMALYYSLRDTATLANRLTTPVQSDMPPFAARLEEDVVASPEATESTPLRA